LHVIIFLKIFRKLAQNAVHSAFSGFTNFTSGVINNHSVIIPVDYISSLGMRKIDTEMDIEYLSLLASTGQPSFLKTNSLNRINNSNHNDTVSTNQMTLADDSTLNGSDVTNN
jgi:hypothetical protein